MSPKFTHAEMVHVLAKDGILIASEIDGKDAHTIHMAIGIAGEAGELLSPFITQGLVVGSELDRGNVVEELGDMEFYLEGLRQGLAINRLECLDGVAIYSPDNMFAASRISVFASEVLDNVKKAVIYRKPLNRKNLVLNLSRLETCMEDLRNNLKIERQDTLDANIAKLGVRYKGFNYSDEKAQARADKTEGE